MLHDINTTNDIEEVVDKLKMDTDTEETTYSLDVDEPHPEGVFPDAKIIEAKKVTGYILVEFETSERHLTKFYKMENGKLHPSMAFLLKAANISSKNFTLPDFIGKVVTVTVQHYEKKNGETGASIIRIE